MDITSAQLDPTLDTIIIVERGITRIVPQDPRNAHYQKITELVNEGTLVVTDPPFIIPEEEDPETPR